MKTMLEDAKFPGCGITVAKYHRLFASRLRNALRLGLQWLQMVSVSRTAWLCFSVQCHSIKWASFVGLHMFPVLVLILLSRMLALFSVSNEGFCFQVLLKRKTG